MADELDNNDDLFDVINEGEDGAEDEHAEDSSAELHEQAETQASSFESTDVNMSAVGGAITKVMLCLTSIHVT